jgi:hypothetical protein
MGLGTDFRDTDKTYSGSRMQGSEKHRIRNTVSSYAVYVCRAVFSLHLLLNILVMKPITEFEAITMGPSLCMDTLCGYMPVRLPCIDPSFWISHRGGAQD